jgi:DNA-binding MarR family transcriptional regulator
MSSSDSVRSRVGYLVKQLQHALRGRMDEKLSEIGLSTSQYALLSAIEEAPGSSGAELARRCFITPQSVNGLIAGLEKAQLIERAPSASHGRIIQTRLAAAGLDRLLLAHRIVSEIEGQMLAALDNGQRGELAELLKTCIAGLN